MKPWEEKLAKGLMEGVPSRPEGPAAAVALILRGQEGIEVLMIERVERDGDPWSGQIALPGGRMEPREASPVATVKREVMEEVGIDLERSCRWLGRLPEVNPMNVPELVVFPFVYSLEADVSVRPGEEVKEAFWACLLEVRRSRTHRRVRVRGVELDVPAFVYRGRVIWGLTFRILSALLERVG